MQIETLRGGHCLLVIPSPTDAAVYGCFRAIAQKWREHVTGESLWIEGNVPLDACLTASQPSAALVRLLASGSSFVMRIELRFGGLLLAYVRSGGQGPALYRLSFFDEIRAEIVGFPSMDLAGILEVFRELTTSLDARRGFGTPEFVGLLGPAGLVGMEPGQ